MTQKSFLRAGGGKLLTAEYQHKIAQAEAFSSFVAYFTARLRRTRSKKG